MRRSRRSWGSLRSAAGATTHAARARSSRRKPRRRWRGCRPARRASRWRTPSPTFWTGGRNHGAQGIVKASAGVSCHSADVRVPRRWLDDRRGPQMAAVGVRERVPDDGRYAHAGAYRHRFGYHQVWAGAHRARRVAAESRRGPDRLSDCAFAFLGDGMPLQASIFGPMEIGLLLLVCLLLFGAKRIPEIAGSFGKGIKEFKKNMSEVQNSIDAPSQSTSLPPASTPVREERTPAAEPKRLIKIEDGRSKMEDRTTRRPREFCGAFSFSGQAADRLRSSILSIFHLGSSRSPPAAVHS